MMNDLTHGGSDHPPHSMRGRFFSFTLFSEDASRPCGFGFWLIMSHLRAKNARFSSLKTPAF